MARSVNIGVIHDMITKRTSTKHFTYYPSSYIATNDNKFSEACTETCRFNTGIRSDSINLDHFCTSGQIDFLLVEVNNNGDDRDAHNNIFCGIQNIYSISGSRIKPQQIRFQ